MSRYFVCIIHIVLLSNLRYGSTKRSNAIKTLEYRIKSTGGKLDNQDTRFVWLIKLKKLALFVNLEGCIELFPKVSTIDVS